MREFERAQYARRADRLSAHLGIQKFERLAVGADEAVGARRGRRGLAPVVGAEFLIGGRVMQDESASA